MPSHTYLAHRRNARIASRQKIVKTDNRSRSKAKECKESFEEFCTYVCGKQPAEHHLEWIKELVTDEDSKCLKRIAGPNTAILAPRGPIASFTQVATPNGWTRISELDYDDVVYTEEGKETKIIGIDDFECMPCYEVTFSDGTKVICDEDHHWKVKDIRGGDWHNVQTLELVKSQYVFYEVPICSAVEYPEFSTLVNPYRIGLLATESNLDITIPELYIHNNIEYRTNILQGILDGIGYVHKGGVYVETNRLKLIGHIKDLVHSLGGIVDIHSGTNGSTLHIKLGIDFPYFQVANKKSLVLDSEECKAVRTILSISSVGKRDVRCIEVEDTFSNFLVKDYIVVNNSAKSTVLGMFTAWAIGIHAEAHMPLKILYLSYTVDVARPKSATIKRIIESKRYMEVFPKVRIQKGVSSNEYWSIDYKHAQIEEIGDEVFSVCCAGLKGSVTSKRSMLIIIDDAIKSAEDIKNAEIRKEMQNNWNSVISPTMFEGGRAICLGTRFRHDDIFATTFVPDKDWKQIVQQAIISNDEGEEISYWPDMWSVPYLKGKKKISPISFSFQYMNQIVRQSEISLSPELLIKAEIATEFDSIGLGVDLSSGMSERNDYTVFVLGGRLGDKIHIIDYSRFRAMGNLEKLDRMMEMLANWNLLTKEGDEYFPTYSTCDIWSEAVQYQASLEADFKRICLNEKSLYNMKWHPVSGFKSDKLARFRGIMGMFEQRNILFNKYRNFSTMFEELTNFGSSNHDDCVDSLVHLVNGLMKKGNLEVDWS
jgi:phage terminase large subunit-like protein